MNSGEWLREDNDITNVGANPEEGVEMENWIQSHKSYMDHVIIENTYRLINKFCHDILRPSCHGR